MIQRPRGTRDFFGTDLQKYQQVECQIVRILENYWFKEMRTPIFEQQELFIRSVGNTTDVVLKEMYSFTDKKTRLLTLRPEGTAGVVRSVVENKLYLPENLPLKIYYWGPMFRYERPQVGRSRQFDQVGVEIFGPKNLYQDLELMALVKTLIETFNLIDHVQLDINYLVSGEARKDYIQSLKKYLEQFPNLCSDCQIRLQQSPLRILDCKIDGPLLVGLPNIVEYATAEQKQFFLAFQGGLDNLQLPFKINPQLVRGLDYYTGIIFELKFLNEQLGSQSTILAGGHYDNLVASLDGPDLPAIGFALGVDRLVLILKELNYFYQATAKSLKLFTIPLNEAALKVNLRLTQQLRTRQIAVDSDLTLKGVKHGLKVATKSSADYVVVLGPKELETCQVTLKNQKDHSLREIPIEDLEKILLEEK